jgi:hypothetical protein
LSKPRLKESPGTNLLVSFLIRHPELSSLRYNPQTKKLTFGIYLHGLIEPARQHDFRSHVESYFVVCRDLEPGFSPLGDVTYAMWDGVTILSYEQSMERINATEVRLFMHLVRDYFHASLGEDVLLPLQPEELEAQEEIIERILSEKERLREESSIVAYRDGGKVFVYNK